MPSVISTDVLIVGAGVAGLWLNARLRGQGFSTVLVESASLGGGQSVKSQGIIHGGAKYALHGALTGASEAIADMPRRSNRSTIRRSAHSRSATGERTSSIRSMASACSFRRPNGETCSARCSAARSFPDALRMAAGDAGLDALGHFVVSLVPADALPQPFAALADPLQGIQ